MEVTILPVPEGHVIARGAYHGGPAYEFFIAADGEVFFQVVGETQTVWAGPTVDSFRRIAAAWMRYRAEARDCQSELAQQELVGRMRDEFTRLGAFPTDMPPDPEPLWSLLLFEAENGLG